MYDPETYWGERLGSAGESHKGAGRKDWPEDVQEAIFRTAGSLVLQVLRDVPCTRLLEIGLGHGHFAGRFRSAFGDNLAYTGLDVTDANFPMIREKLGKLPGGADRTTLVKADITEGIPVSGPFDVVVMLDVEQHIVDDDKYARAMANIVSVIRPGGRFVTTSWLENQPQRLPYEKRRDLGLMRSAFPIRGLRPLIPYRDKYLIVIDC